MSRHRVATGPVVVVAVAAAVIGADDLTKRWARRALAEHAHHVLGPLWWRLQFNSGVSFSLGASSSPVAVFVSSAVLVAVVFAAARALPGWAALGWGLVVGGGVANLWDRLHSPIHQVTDFIAVGGFPVFNLADAALSAGFALLISLLLAGRRVWR
ncbi:MAG: signal peptidase II [Acidobacteria bacterium]|nr:signal peptidase II [Acidobacteriota bacterium]